MKQDLINLFIFFGICVVSYLIFANLSYKEGMKGDISGNIVASGLAGSSPAYNATIKAETIKLQDMLLINKYRKEYETTILNLEDLVSSMMIQTALTIDVLNPDETFLKLNNLYQTRNSLNYVMELIDKTF